MINLGLTNAQQVAFEAALVTSHDMRVKVSILDRNEKVLGNLQPKVLSGAVQVDATQMITRSLSLVCLDPDHKLTFDGNSPAEGALFADNFIAVRYGVHVQTNGLDFWVDCPVFHGPLSQFEREGPQVTIEAQGKESLGLDPHLVVNGYTIHRGTSVANAIKDVMDRLGENKYSLAAISGKLHKHRPVHTNLSPWAVVVGGGTDAAGNPIPGLASKASGNKYVFYNGLGYLTAKNRVTPVRWVFDGTCVVAGNTEPTVTYDISSVRNHVEVTGGTPKKSKKHFRGSATLPASNPLSPWSLARNGKPRYMATFYQSDSLKSDEACRQKAQALLDGQQSVSASFDGLVIPHLEENDTVALRLSNISLSWPIKQFTIPLTADTSMSVGYLKPVKPRRARRRSR